MYKFAKVFESNGREVLIMKNKTEEGEPKLSVIVHFDNGKQLDAGMVLSGGTFENLDSLFELAGQNECDSVTKFITPGMTAMDYLMSLKEEVKAYEEGEMMLDEEGNRSIFDDVDE